MRKHLLSLLLVAALALALLPLSFAVAHEHGAHLRVAHLSPTSPAVDVFLNGEKVIENLAFKGVTDYLALEGTTFELVIVPAGGKIEDSVTEEPIKLTFDEDDRGFYTAAVVGSLADKTFEVVLLNDNPAHGMAAMKSAAKGEARVGDIVITGAFARPTVKAGGHGHSDHGHGDHGHGNHGDHSRAGQGGLGVSAAYMKIENKGSQADVLIAAETDVAGLVELHETVVENNMAKMKPLAEGISLPPGVVTELKPGGLHIMLMQMKRELKAGDSITLTLIFKSGKRVTFDLPVRMP
ncbi:MAG: copper chaperone PCu(A)C [Chloroflexi bacterium]|nr:copper chaperone PCu(A)C [Chloroflexota bacterium]